jgi:hypothetical protein
VRCYFQRRNVSAVAGLLTRSITANWRNRLSRR